MNSSHTQICAIFGCFCHTWTRLFANLIHSCPAFFFVCASLRIFLRCFFCCYLLARYGSSHDETFKDVFVALDCKTNWKINEPTTWKVNQTATAFFYSQLYMCLFGLIFCNIYSMWTFVWLPPRNHSRVMKHFAMLCDLFNLCSIYETMFSLNAQAKPSLTMKFMMLCQYKLESQKSPREIYDWIHISIDFFLGTRVIFLFIFWGTS